MNIPPPLDERAAAAYARRLTEIERRIVESCSRRASWGYTGLAERLGTTYDEARSAGLRLQARNLAHVSPVRAHNEFNGSAIFLNERGEQVRRALEASKQKRQSADHGSG